jgi:hypothetical protein
MNDYGVLVFSAVVLILLWWLTFRPAPEERRPVPVILARLLRRLGRWFWALGEALEIGFFHGRHVRERISLDLETSESGAER